MPLSDEHFLSHRNKNHKAQILQKKNPTTPARGKRKRHKIKKENLGQSSVIKEN